MKDQRSVWLIPLKDPLYGKSRLKPALTELEILRFSTNNIRSIFNSLKGIEAFVLVDTDRARELCELNGFDFLYSSVQGLNNSVQFIVNELFGQHGRATRISVIHSDVIVNPFEYGKAANDWRYVELRDLDLFLSRTKFLSMAPDFKENGTNFISVPAHLNWTYQFGDNSYKKHLVQAEQKKIETLLMLNTCLSLDIDDFDDYKRITES